MPATPTIPLLLPELPGFDALEPWLRRIDANRHYTNFGPLSGEFERALGERHGSAEAPAHTVSFSSGTAALVAWLITLTAQRKGRVLVPAVTFAATAQAILASGNTPLIADIDPSDWLLSPQLARDVAAREDLVTIVPVAAYGAPCDPGAWDLVTRDTGIPVLVDAAGAYGNQMLGATTDIAFSFHATKALSAGEGGAVLTRDRNRATALVRASNFGIDTRDGLVVAAGINAKLSEYHAAVGLASLDAWPDNARRRHILAERYTAEIATHCPTVALPPRPANGVYTLMPVQIPAGHGAADVGARLAAAGIQTRRWYCPPLHLHPHFGDLPRWGSLPHAEALGHGLLGLPFHLDLSDTDVTRVCMTLGQLLDAGPRHPAGKNFR